MVSSPSSLVAIAVGIVIALASNAVSAQPAQPSETILLEHIRALLCRGDPGSRCCAADSEVPTLHCATGAGCNVTTGRCEACGEPGQPCCDGPLTGFSGKCYSNSLNPKSCESCNEGATCDARLSGGKWVGSRVCLPCGTTLGKACCAPDVRYALYRCSRDSATGRRMDCADAWGGGTCEVCGMMDQRPCSQNSPQCDVGLAPKGDRCVPCGALGQPSCDGSCNPGLDADRMGMCVPSCGKVGQPCCEFGCKVGYLACSAGICRHAGLQGEPCLAGATCGPAADGFPLTCRDNTCQRVLNTKGFCEACRFDDQCIAAWEGFEPLCINGQCVTRERHTNFIYPTDLCHPKPNPCAGKICQSGDQCFEGRCRSCGYPNGECCNGPIFGGCYGGGLLQCGWDNKCH